MLFGLLFIYVICIHTIVIFRMRHLCYLFMLFVFILYSFLEWDSISKQSFTTVSIWRAGSFEFLLFTYLLNITLIDSSSLSYVIGWRAVETYNSLWVSFSPEGDTHANLSRLLANISWLIRKSAGDGLHCVYVCVCVFVYIWGSCHRMN